MSKIENKKCAYVYLYIPGVKHITKNGYHKPTDKIVKIGVSDTTKRCEEYNLGGDAICLEQKLINIYDKSEAEKELRTEFTKYFGMPAISPNSTTGKVTSRSEYYKYNTINEVKDLFSKVMSKYKFEHNEITISQYNELKEELEQTKKQLDIMKSNLTRANKVIDDLDPRGLLANNDINLIVDDIISKYESAIAKYIEEDVKILPENNDGKNKYINLSNKDEKDKKDVKILPENKEDLKIPAQISNNEEDVKIHTNKEIVDKRKSTYGAETARKIITKLTDSDTASMVICARLVFNWFVQNINNKKIFNKPEKYKIIISEIHGVGPRTMEKITTKQIKAIFKKDADVNGAIDKLQLSTLAKAHFIEMIGS